MLSERALVVEALYEAAGSSAVRMMSMSVAAGVDSPSSSPSLPLSSSLGVVAAIDTVAFSQPTSLWRCEAEATQ